MPRRSTQPFERHADPFREAAAARLVDQPAHLQPDATAARACAARATRRRRATRRARAGLRARASCRSPAAARRPRVTAPANRRQRHRCRACSPARRAVRRSERGYSRLAGTSSAGAHHDGCAQRAASFAALRCHAASAAAARENGNAAGDGAERAVQTRWMRASNAEEELADPVPANPTRRTRRCLSRKRRRKTPPPPTRQPTPKTPPPSSRRRRRRFRTPPLADERADSCPNTRIQRTRRALRRSIPRRNHRKRLAALTRNTQRRTDHVGSGERLARRAGFERIDLIGGHAAVTLTTS